MRRSDRAASLLSRKAQLMLEVVEPHVLASRNLLLASADRLDLLRRHVLGLRESSDRSHVPADRIANRFCPAEAVSRAATTELRHCLWRQRGRDGLFGAGFHIA